MAAAFDDFERASFNGIEFLWHSIRIHSALRKHIHEYRHTPGGAPEKQGRSIYTFHMACTFDEALNARTISGGKAYNDNYPGAVAKLRALFERETTASLVVPTFGKIDAFITDWTQIAEPEKRRSGEIVEIEFVEDMTTAFETLTKLVFTAGLGGQLASLTDIAGGLNVPLNIFDAITDAVNAVLAIKDQADLYAQLVTAKVLALSDLCAKLDAELDAFQHPENWQLTEAFKDLWASASDLAANVTQNAAMVASKTTPSLMTLQEVSTFIYGRSDKGFDLLSLNVFEDVLAIPAGTVVRYVVES